jgi:hypothetical protein
MTTQVAEFIAKYTPEIAEAIELCRKKMYALVPRGYELVYDNYNTLAFGFAPSEKASDAVLSIAAYPRWITLFFLKGASLVDPDSLLEGAGSQVRSIRLLSPRDLDSPGIRKLVSQALEPFTEAFAAAPEIKTIVKSISDKQRPRRPTEKESKTSGSESPLRRTRAQRP